ncbi:MAG TPA: prolyl oligopeptidase family serine peptidase [Cyclobacteriaceae bacterium]|nr:prolyl oligopeptidase family serine peptidase [Cyclobacteriaceae bacterium]
MNALRPSLLVALILIVVDAESQNGKIIEQSLYHLHDSLLTRMEKIIPNIYLINRDVNFYHIIYLSDGLKVKGYLAVPKKEGKYPCIIYNRGGNREFGKITEASFVRGIGELSSMGYIVAGSQYRGNDGGEGNEEFGGKDVNDVLNLIPLFSQINAADTSRMGMFGWSRGGMMTYIALSKTKKMKAAVVGSGLADLIKTLETRPEFDSLVFAQLIPSYTNNKINALKERSAVYFADKINKTTPILVLQGTADWRVPSDQVLDLVKKFYDVNQPVRFILYEGGQHSLAEFRNDCISQIENWFNTYLRDRKPWPNLEPHGD